MKRMQWVIGVSYMLVAGLLAAGCGKSSPSAPPGPAAGAPATNAAVTHAPATNAPAGKSTMDTFIDGATGKTALDARRFAQDKIRKISAEHNKDMDEVTQ